MRRREFITLFAGSAAILPLGALAQQPTIPVVGFFRSSPAKPFTHIVAAFCQGLNETGFVEGQNVTIEQRWGDNQLDQLPALAADLVRRQPAVIVGNGPAVEAARSAAATIPIVFVIGGDPVSSGLVTSLSRPGGNLTGVTFFGNRLGAKRVEMLHELIPGASVIATLTDSTFPEAVAELHEVEEAIRTIGQKIVPVNASNEREINAAFASIAQAGVGALVVMGGPFFTSKSQMLVDLSARYAIPTIYDLRENVEVGGLISYSASFTDAYRQAGVYAGRILKGAKPSELQPTAATTQRDTIVPLIARNKLPAVYPFRYLVAGGGLASIGPDVVAQCRLAASYVDRILKGEKPGDLPVQAPNKYEVVINLKTAKALGLSIPPALLAAADEVIE